MTEWEFITGIESTWGRKFTAQQSAIYRDKIKRFNGEQLKAILSRLTENCESLPKVAHIYQTAGELGFISKTKSSDADRTLGHPDCGACRGTGWNVVRQYEELYQREVDAVRPCSCRNGPIPYPRPASDYPVKKQQVPIEGLIRPF